jgi:hypothetical protein
MSRGGTSRPLAALGVLLGLIPAGAITLAVRALAQLLS